MKTYLIGILGFCLFFSAARAQNPGGVSTGLQLWVRANAGTSTTTNGSPVDTWTYTNNGANSFSAAGAARPTYTQSAINFQPSLTFSGAQLMDGPAGVNAPIAAGDDDYSLFVVWQSTSPGISRVWSQRNLGASNAADGFALAHFTGPEVYGDQIEYPNYIYSVTRTFTTGTWNVTQLNLLNQPTSDLEIVDDRNISTGALIINSDPGGAPNGPALRNLATGVNRIGARDNTGDEPFTGNIAEIIVYNASKGTTDRSQIFSYLAMKYGITIKTNLVNSANSVVWNAAANSVYNNSVFGLAKDNNSGLTVNQSNSIVTGSGTGVGQSGKANIVLSNPSSLDDGDFLEIGNDNASLSEITTDLPLIAAGSKRFGREWKVQHTGNAGTVSLSVDLTGLTISGIIGTLGDFRLLVDADGDGDFTNGTTRLYYPAGFTGNVINFNGVTLNNNEVFTLISKTNATSLPVTWKNVQAKLVNNSAVIDWSVENNADALKYAVEHSVDGIQYSTIGTVMNDAAKSNYSFTHNLNTSGKQYYRIRQFDIDGSSQYSKVVFVVSKVGDFTINLRANPVLNNTAILEVNAKSSAHAEVSLWNTVGTRLLLMQRSLDAGNNQWSIPVEKIPAGLYILKCVIGDEVFTQQLIRQ